MSLALDLTRQQGGRWYGDYGVFRTPWHSARDRGTVIRDRADGRGVLIYSFNADWREVRDALGLTAEQAAPMTVEARRKLQADMAKAKAEREGQQLARCADLAQSGVRPEPGSPVWSYLTGRGISGAFIARAVNAGALLEHRDEHGRVSMLALAHNRNGVLRGVQMTKLRADGSGKRGTDCDRLTFGPYKGAACRLFKVPDDTLAVAEGTETALAFSVLRCIPCWSTFGTRNLESFEPPAGVRTLIIAADGDRAAPDKPCEFKGLDAADALFDRLKRRLRVVIAAAPDGLDWCDVLNQGGAHVAR
ncbi:MAG: toprim domain-containing protein [Hyphomonadaceae bacterium]|nr:toprim domain-containing protein [Hyphomonadaceae bacterium]